jgi:hypothetical protein
MSTEYTSGTLLINGNTKDTMYEILTVPHCSGFKFTSNFSAEGFSLVKAVRAFASAGCSLSVMKALALPGSRKGSITRLGKKNLISLPAEAGESLPWQAFWVPSVPYMALKLCIAVITTDVTNEIRAFHEDTLIYILKTEI